MRCEIYSTRYRGERAKFAEHYKNMLSDYDFKAILKTTKLNDYETETKVDYCCIIIDDMEQLKLLFDSIPYTVIIMDLSTRTDCD